MATNNSNNNQFDNNSDGFDLSGGTTKRKLTVTGADITLTGSGSNTYTYPASTDTLVGRASTDTLTNKTITSATNTVNANTINYGLNANGTTSSVTSSKIQSGWGYVQGNGTNNISVTVTFPSAFTTIQNVIIGSLGLNLSTAPTALTSFNAGYSGNIVMFQAYSISNSSMTVRGTLDSSATLATNVYAGFSWIAFGA